MERNDIGVMSITATIRNAGCITHTPGEGHTKWQERKNSWKKGAKADTAAATPAKAETPNAAAPTTSSSTADPKLALSKSLQAALLTTAGLTQNQFQKIWDDACNESGN